MASCVSCNSHFRTKHGMFKGPKCKKCWYREDYYPANRQKVIGKSLANNLINPNYAANKRKYQRSTRVSTRYVKGKAIAKFRGLSWDLTVDQYERVVTNNCHYCNSSLSDERGSSLDRRNNDLGYLLENVLPCCGKCNRIRNSLLTVEEMEVAMKAVVAYRTR